jgi:hypothetical protein
MSLVTNESSKFHKHEATKKKDVLIVACCVSWDFYLCKAWWHMHINVEVFALL